jgi:excinuclease ABC subunit C
VRLFLLVRIGASVTIRLLAPIVVISRKGCAVQGLFSRPRFTGFGPCGLDGTIRPLVVVQGRRPSRLKALVRRDGPREPGVYGMLDGRGELIYVGKAKSLRARLLSYFRPNSRDPKAGRIVAQTRRLVWEPAACEFAALLRELELIRRWQPRWNVWGQPTRRRRGYVCVGRRPAPYLFLSSRPPSTAFACFGPIPLGETAREAVRRLNDCYQLRDCPQAQAMAFADQGELFPEPRAAGCLRLEIATCLGPCAAACTRADYDAAVKAAMRFLRGEDAGPVERLERQMHEAAATTEFERAVVLRDRLRALQWLLHHLERPRRAVERSFVYTVPGPPEEEMWYLIHRGRAMSALPVPRGAGQCRSARSALAAAYRGAAPGPPGLDEIDGVLLVDAWFRKHPEECARTLTPEEALRTLAVRET